MTERSRGAGPIPLALVTPAAFAAVYLIWGSTYLAIRIGIESIPPLLMASVRFLAAGAIAYAWARWQGASAPGRREWIAGGIAGALMLAGGNGGVSLGQTRIDSGLTALLVATVPLWMVVIDWLRPGGRPPARAALAGLLLGVIGVALLADPREFAGAGGVDAWGALIVLFAALSWAAGSIYSREAPKPGSLALTIGIQMFAGGLVLGAGSLALGEVSRFDASAVTAASLWAAAYLAVFGSIVGFAAYAWLLRATTPARAGSYAFVNPVVAVLLGAAFAGEPLTLRTLLAAAVIVAGAAIVVLTREAGPRAGGREPPAEVDAAAPEPAR